MNSILLISNIILFSISYVIGQNPVEVKLSRRPNRFDNILCRQKNAGYGIKSSAVFNYSGEVCKTYCRIINRINRTASFAEYVSPNNIRCGPMGARCVEGVCTPPGSQGPNSGAISQVAPTGRRLRPSSKGIVNRRRPGRKGTSSPQKTTSVVTTEEVILDPPEKETETLIPDVVVNESGESGDTDINAKIIFPKD